MLLKFILIPIASSLLIYLAIAFGLVFSQRPQSQLSGTAFSFQSIKPAPENHGFVHRTYTPRDGTALPVWHSPAQSKDAPLVIVIHGSGWHGGGYLGLAQGLAAAGDFEMLVPDLRGHGLNPTPRGDVSYIGQFEDDLADLITDFNADNRDVIMIGHSSGGGLVIRFAGGPHGALLSKAVLLAPFLKHNAPTMREKSGGWAHALTGRIIGLSMLNTLNITALNSMTILQFNFPRAILDGAEGHTATLTYSYRLNTSFAPRNAYLDDIAKLPEFLLLVGEKDDAFYPEAFEPVMADVTANGTYQILANADHLGLINDLAAQAAILAFLAK
ncbi:MAG: alpha/beta hydrolase [Halocynthiibacter sp.]